MEILLVFSVFFIGAASAQIDTKCVNDTAVNDCFADINKYFDDQFPNKNNPWAKETIDGKRIRSWTTGAYMSIRWSYADDKIDVCSVPDKFKTALSCALNETVTCAEQRNDSVLGFVQHSQALAGFDFMCDKSKKNEIDYGCLVSALVTGFKSCYDSKKKDIQVNNENICRLERIRLECVRKIFAYKPGEKCEKSTENTYLEFLSKYHTPASCPGCAMDQFQCSTGGQCVANSRTCDDTKDCADGSDEDTFCPTKFNKPKGPSDGVNAVGPASLLVFLAAVVTSLMTSTS